MIVNLGFKESELNLAKTKRFELGDLVKFRYSKDDFRYHNNDYKLYMILEYPFDVFYDREIVRIYDIENDNISGLYYADKFEIV